MNKTIGLVIGAALIASAAFAGGWFLSGGGSARSGQGGPGGFTQLSVAERAQLQNMSEPERKAFFEEKGIDMPTGGPRDQAGPTGPGVAPSARPGRGSSLLEGTVSGLSEDKITVTLAAGGSANAYLDEATVVASVDGESATLEEGAAVLIFAEPEAPGVNAAKAVIIK